MYWRSLTTPTQSHHVTPHVNYLQSFPWIHVDSQAPGSPKLHLWFRQLTPWIQRLEVMGQPPSARTMRRSPPGFFLTESLSTGVHHRSEISVVSCLAQCQITHLWHLLYQTWVTLIYRTNISKHLPKVKRLAPRVWNRLWSTEAPGRFFGPPGMPPCDIGSPCLVQWGISRDHLDGNFQTFLEV